MKFTTHFFNKPSVPGSVPYCFSNPTEDFGSVEEARSIALATAGAEKMQAHSVLIESDDGKIHEKWVREGDTWRRENA
jgi:hypothetical protein